MDISFFVLPLNILIFVVGISLIVRSWPYHRRPEIQWLLLMVSSFCLISFCGMNVYSQGAFEAKALFSRLRFLGLAVIGPSWLLFLVSTYGGSRWKSIKPLLLLFFAPALVTVLMVLIPNWNHYLVKNFAPFTWEGYSVVQFSDGIWLPVHIINSSISAVTGVGFALYTAVKSPGVKRRQLLILAFGSILSFAVDRYCGLFAPEHRWAMISGATFLFTELAVLYAIVRHGFLDLSEIAKDKIFKNIPDPILIFDKQQLLLDFNTAAMGLFSLSTSDKLRPWNPDQKKFYINSCFQNHEWTCKNDKHGERYFMVRSQMLGSDHSLSGTIVILQEFTERKRIELELNNHLEFKARLMSLIAHDFSGFLQAQTLLTSSLSSIEDRDNLEFRKGTGALLSSVFASKDFMTNILNWAKTQTNSFKPAIKPFEFNVLINEVVESQISLLEIKKIHPVLISNSTPLVFEGDSLMIESIVRNILNNAIRASREGGEIEIHLTAIENSVQISVTDHGHGMSQRDLLDLNDSICKATPRYDETSEGFGIGLTIAQKFVDLHNGKLEISSVLELGTTVTVTLPF